MRSTDLAAPTISVGRIEGGVSVNTVPDRCRIEIDRRLLPGEDPDGAAGQLLAYLREHVGGQIDFSCSNPWLSAPALGPEDSESLVARLLRAAEPVAGKRQVMAVPYGTDAGPLARTGVPCVVFGPGDIALAHTCDEWVPVDEVAQAAEILYRLAWAS